MILQHQPAHGGMRPGCACGWRSKRVLDRVERLSVSFAQHARDVGCGKARFEGQAAAMGVLVDAKIAADLHGSRRRREQRAYRCNDGCPQDVWHLSSQAQRAAVG